MRKVKKWLIVILAVMAVVASPFVILLLRLMEALCCEHIGRLIYRLDTYSYRFWERLSPETIYILDKPDLDSTLRWVTGVRSALRSMRVKYWEWCKQAYTEFKKWCQKHEDSKLLILMDTDSSNPFYKETFKFLKHYFGVYRILPGILPVDKYGILHIKINVLERKNDNLTIEELEKGLHIRLVNTLMKSNDLIDIPFGYWSVSTVYFPDLEKNLENDYLVIMLALSKAGSNRIMALRNEKEHTTCDDLEETL